MKAALLASVLVLAFLAGCAQTGTGPSPGTDPSGAPTRYALPFDQMPEGDGHDHGDPATHKFLWNYDFASRDPILSNPANAAGLHAMELANGYLFGAIYGSHGVAVDGGVQIWDVHTDPGNPRPLGRWTIPGAVGGDRSIGATPDGEFVVIGTEPVDCFGHANPLAAVSAYLLDVRNKDLPVVVDAISPSGGTLGDPSTINPRLSTHSVWVHRIAGVDYAFIFGDIYMIDRTESSGARLQYVSTVNTGHDLYVRDTPFNRTWAFSADGDPGDLVVHDVTDPRAIFEIGRMPRGSLSTADGARHYLHTADAVFLGNQTIIVLTSEDFEAWPSPFWVIDGNGLEAVAPGGKPVELTELGRWQNPYNHTAEDMQFSLHNPRIHDGGLLTVASYHAGFFQFDLRHPDFWAEPSLIASAAYAAAAGPAVQDPGQATLSNSSLCYFIEQSIDTPSYIDVAVGENGTVYMADVYTGLYAFTPAASHPVYGTAVAAVADSE